MITEEQYNEAKKLILQYESEQVILSKSLTFTIPKEKWGIHRIHCCYEHGCKYGNENCPVVLGLIRQDYPCEMCKDEYDID